MNNLPTSTDGTKQNATKIATEKVQESNITQEKQLFDVESQVTHAMHDDGVITIIHGTGQSSLIASVCIETETQSESNDLSNKKSKSWLDKGNQSPLIYQTQEVQPQQAQQNPYPPPGPYPPQGYPPQGYPPQGYPPQGYPPQGYPPPGYPQQGYPQQGYPPPGYPPPSYPQDLAREESITRIPYDPETRNRFVAKVMLIVMIMLLCTAAFIIFVFASENLRDFFDHYKIFMLIIAMIGLISANISLMCCEYGRRFPCNIIMLFITVVSMSILAAVITTRYRTEIIIYAALATAGITLLCYVLARTKFDFTKWYLYIVVIAGGFSVLAIVVLLGMALTGHYMKPVHIAILVVCVLVQAVILVLELQMILGGKTVELGQDEWAVAAFMLYTSIVDIFLKMVQILGLLDS